jgi:HEAT repeat protein
MTAPEEKGPNSATKALGRSNRTLSLTGLCLLILSILGTVVALLRGVDWPFVILFIGIGFTALSSCFLRLRLRTRLVFTIVGLLCAVCAIVGILLTGNVEQVVQSTDQTQNDAQTSQAEAKAGKTIEEFISDLHHPNYEIRADACRALAELGPKALPALPTLIETLSDQNEHVRFSAAGAIAEIGPEAAAAVPGLIKALRDPDSYVCQWAARSLGCIGAKAKPAIPALIELLNNNDKDVESDSRAYAADALSHIGQEPDISLPTLAEALKRLETRCRRFGSMAFYANRDLHRAIADSLARFGQQAVPVLTDLLKDSKDDVRWSALYALGEIGPKARVATEAICKLIQDRDEGVAALAVYTLVDIEASPERVIPLFTESLKSKSGHMRFAAAESLGRYGPKSRAAIPLLIEVYHAHDIDIGGSLYVVGKAIKSIDPEAARKAGVE